MRTRPGEHNEADLGTKMVDLRRMTSLQPPVDWSSWKVATTLSAVAEAAKDCRVLIWNVRNMSGTSGWFWICVGMVIAILTVLSGGLSGNPISDDCSRQKETDKNAARRRPMKNELEHREKVFQIRTAWNPVVNGVACGHEVCKSCLDGSAVHPVCVKARPSVERRQSDLSRRDLFFV